MVGTPHHGRAHPGAVHLDIAVRNMAFGRVALIGDAAFAARPHAAAGTAKAAADASSLAAARAAEPGAALRPVRTGQVRIARCDNASGSSC